MAFAAGKNTAFTFDGTVLTSFISNISLSRAGENADSTTFGNDDRDYLQVMRGANINLSGFWDNGASGVDKKMSDALTNGTLVTFSLQFSTASSPVTYSGSCLVQSYEATAVTAELDAFAAVLQVSGPVTRS